MNNAAGANPPVGEQDILDILIPETSGECDVDDMPGEEHAGITHHNFLDTDPTDDEKTAYIKSFAIILASTGGDRESKYLNAVSSLFGCGDAADETYKLADDLKAGNRRMEAMDALKVVSSYERQANWIMDAFVVGTDSGAAGEKTETAVLKVADRLFKPLPGELSRCNLEIAKGMATLVSADEGIGIAEAIESIERMGTGETIRAFVRRGIGQSMIEYYGFGALLKKLQNSRTGIDETDVVDNPAGIEIKTLGPCDFLCKDVLSIVVFRDFWYVLCVRDNTLELLRSDDAENWNTVELPDGLTNTESDWNRNWEWMEIKLKAMDGNLLIVAPRGWQRSFWYSPDGINFKEIERSFDNYVTDVFHADKWYLQISRDAPFSYLDGKLFKTTKYSTYSKTVFFCADELDGEWSECSDLDFGDGMTIVAGTVFTSCNGLFAVSERDSSYRCSCNLKERVELGYVTASSWEWKRASCDRSFTDVSGLYTSSDFIELAGAGFLFSAFDRNPSDIDLDREAHGVFYSRGGRAWRYVHDPFHTPFFKLGGWACAFAASVDSDGESGVIQLHATKDGQNYKYFDMQLPCMPFHIASNGNKALLMTCDDKLHIVRFA